MIINSIYSQEVKYRLIVKDTCNNTYDVHYFYWIYKDTIELQNSIQPSVDIITGFSTLKDTGTYYLSEGYYYGAADKNPFHKIKITNFGLINDTIILNNLQEVTLFSNPPFTEYLCCGKRCNGFESTYYQNGKLKMQGKFSNGQPIGDLTKYYYSGKLKERHTFKKKHRIYRYYDLDNEEVNTILDVKINKYPFWVFKKKMKHDSSGNKLYEVSRNRRIEYFIDGRVKSKLKWHKKFIQSDSFWNYLFFWKNNHVHKSKNKSDYIIKYKEFNKENELILKTKSHAYYKDKHYCFETYLDSSWIIYYIEYDKNKVAKKIENVNINILKK